MPLYITWLDYLGVSVFAMSGALVASRKQMDIIGFALVATVTGIGGGTLRDIILDRPVFWISEQFYLFICLVIACIGFFFAHRVQKRYNLLLWFDAIGISAYGILGAHLALNQGASFLPAITLGVMTATFGGLVRDVITNETPLILKHEVYATAALLSACTYVALRLIGVDITTAAIIGTVFGFALRACGIQFQLSLPRYRPRKGADY